ncbi:MAG TPA: hypothetical protein VHT49_02565 [Acidimicrobiales bacterium]|jgi:protein-S-isoprenylcysteine O-methyltransferase Ste14|nr:hypothetical protein [Acidimicrobiales bacterium]
MWTRGVVGVVLCLVGAVFVAQGTNALSGSHLMSGHPGYAVLGGVLIVIGLALLGWAWRLRSRRAG